MDSEFAKGSRDELRSLLGRRPTGPRALFQRYIMGRGTEEPLSKDVLAAKLGWDENEETINARRLRIIRDELGLTMEGLREQFAKIATFLTLFGLVIAFSLSGPAKDKTVLVVCLAAVVAVWVQSPRLKIFGFRKREDSGLRVGAILTDLDEYHYVYCWLLRREETLHAAEVLVWGISIVGIATLGYLAITA